MSEKVQAPKVVAKTQNNERNQSGILNQAEEKLAKLPKSVWDELRKQGFYIPNGSFSNRYYTQFRLRPEAIRECERPKLKQVLFNALDALLEHGVDGTVLRNFADDALTEADREMFLDLALIADERPAPEDGDKIE